jgi:fatty-acyl-CoA synthase
MDADGYCRIRGRLKDMIIRGGENIYPREIEDVLFTHPGVADVSVIGVPDAEWGEIVVAFVQPRPGRRLSGDDLAAFCREHLASYKTPRIWRFVDQLPQTASGKVQKFMLRDRFDRETNVPRL